MNNKNTPWILTAVALIAVALILIACAALKPGSDPLVVRTEQFLTGAQGLFLFTLQVDNQDRGFWRTNAPAFHAFAEGLRTPTQYQVTNTLPRYRAGLLSLDDVKLDYKNARTTGNSNALFTALATWQSFASQANSWLTIVTNR